VKIHWAKLGLVQAGLGVGLKGKPCLNRQSRGLRRNTLAVLSHAWAKKKTKKNGVVNVNGGANVRRDKKRPPSGSTRARSTRKVDRVGQGLDLRKRGGGRGLARRKNGTEGAGSVR